MALKDLSQRPTSQADYAFSDYTYYSRSEFVAAYPLGASSVCSIIGGQIAEEIAEHIPYLPYVLATTDAMSGLTSLKKTEFVNAVYTAFTLHPMYEYVLVGSQFKGYQKGSQGWFWIPANGYRVLYT